MVEDMYKLLIRKGYTILYYMRIDPRPRAQYIHVVRDYRKRLLNILPSLPKESQEEILVRDLVSIIPPKVMSQDCYSVMEKVGERLGILGELPEKVELIEDHKYDE